MDLDTQKIASIKQLYDKVTLSKENSAILRELLVLGSTEFNYIKDHYKVYETCLFLESKINLLANKGLVNIRKLKPKQIVMVDLGTDTYGHEFSYEHPCIVLLNDYSRTFVVPCTSQLARRDKQGKLFKGTLEGTISDGFKKTTTILLTEAKFIDKTRIKSSLGFLSDEKYNELYNELFILLFESKSYSIKKLSSSLTKKNEELEKSLKEVAYLEGEVHKLELENRNQKQEIKKIQSRYNILKNIIKSSKDTEMITKVDQFID